MKLRVLGLKPEFDADTWNKMKRVWDACKAAEVDPPQEVEDFFGDEGPCDDAIGINLVETTCAAPFSGESGQIGTGYDIDVTDLPGDVETIKVLIVE